MFHDSETSSAITTQGASLVATSGNRPHLLRTDVESIRILPRLYDQYSDEVTAGAQHLTASWSTTTEAIRPVNLKFCIDPEYLESPVTLGLIPDVEDHDTPTNWALRSYLDYRFQAPQESMSLDTLENVVDRDLRMDITDTSARSPMEFVLVSHHALFRSNGIG